ncbi:hypothetical protein GALMADRAFT_81674, partial [Galerina marginata CBS 339.88]
IIEKGLQGMGTFGTTKGHKDKQDSVASYTEMISHSQLPEGYEPGRFHLLRLGIYISLTPFTVSGFCGIDKHGGTPPIAPPGVIPSPDAYRMMVVCYPPWFGLHGAGVKSLPLASMPKGQLLTLGPEFTTYR